MPVVDDEDRPKKKLAHEIGQELALLSVEELRERIGLLRDEIARLEAAMTAKQASRASADHVLQALIARSRRPRRACGAGSRFAA